MVLRLPPHHCELNPIELVWQMVKPYVVSNNTTYETSDVEYLLYQAITRMKPEDWQSSISRVMDEEQTFWEAHILCENYFNGVQTPKDHVLEIGD